MGAEGEAVYWSAEDRIKSQKVSPHNCADRAFVACANNDGRDDECSLGNFEPRGAAADLVLSRLGFEGADPLVLECPESMDVIFVVLRRGGIGAGFRIPYWTTESGRWEFFSLSNVRNLRVTPAITRRDKVPLNRRKTTSQNLPPIIISNTCLFTVVLPNEQ